MISIASFSQNRIQLGVGIGTSFALNSNLNGENNIGLSTSPIGLSYIFSESTNDLQPLIYLNGNKFFHQQVIENSTTKLNVAEVSILGGAHFNHKRFTGEIAAGPAYRTAKYSNTDERYTKEYINEVDVQANLFFGQSVNENITLGFETTLSLIPLFPEHKNVGEMGELIDNDAHLNSLLTNVRIKFNL